MGNTRREFLTKLLLSPMAGALSGCALFEKTLAPLKLTAKKLPPIQLPPHALQLDVVVVERPAGDPRLREPLWQHVDELGAVGPETRSVLREHGFRVGVVASHPPVALQEMLGLKTEFAYEPDIEKAKQLVGHQFIVSSGAEKDILASNAYPECELELPVGNELRPTTLTNASCLFRMTAHKLQDGWSQLEFVPQIQHGDTRDRYIPDESNWRYRHGQRVEVFYLQRFQVRLSVGEMAIITAQEDASGRLGDLFFRGPAALSRESNDPNASSDPITSVPVQRLLVVRLSGMDSQDTTPHA